jgi:hypothetical protein
VTLTLDQFQKDALPWLAKLKKTGETLLIVAGEEKFEVRPAGTASPRETVGELEKALPKRDIIVGDPEDLVHLDWSSEWRP